MRQIRTAAAHAVCGMSGCPCGAGRLGCATTHRQPNLGADGAQVVTVPGVIRVALGRRLVAVAAAVAGVAISWLFAAVQQYAFDDLSGRRLPYVPDVWFGAYEAVYERLGLPLGLSQYYFWGRFAFLICLWPRQRDCPSAWTVPAYSGRTATVVRRLRVGSPRRRAGLLGPAQVKNSPR